MCLDFIYHCAISLPGFYNEPVQNGRETTQRLTGHRAVSAAAHRNHTDMALHCAAYRTEVMWRSYHGYVTVMYFGAFMYQKCTTSDF